MERAPRLVRSRASPASRSARRSPRSARSGCSPRRARPATRASPTSSPSRPSSPACRRSSLVVPPIPGEFRRGRPRRARRVPQARHRRRVPRQRSSRDRRARLRHRDRSPQVRKIVGPGSPAVTIAQVEMQRHGVATMMLLGPTESLVIADDSADPVRLAADLLIEAEHGTDTLGRAAHDSRPRSPTPSTPNSNGSSPISPRSAPTAARASLGPNGGCVLVDRPRRGRPCRQRVRSRAPAGRGRRRRRRPASSTRLVNAGEILDRPAHAVQRRQLRHRVPGIAADERASPTCRRASPPTRSSSAPRSPAPTTVALARMTPSVLALADHEGFPAHGNALRLRRG